MLSDKPRRSWNAGGICAACSWRGRSSSTVFTMTQWVREALEAAFDGLEVVCGALYYGGLKFVPLGFERLVILQSVNKVKLNL